MMQSKNSIVQQSWATCCRTRWLLFAVTATSMHWPHRPRGSLGWLLRTMAAPGAQRQRQARREKPQEEIFAFGRQEGREGAVNNRYV